jgi:hypothetical protein
MTISRHPASAPARTNVARNASPVESMNVTADRSTRTGRAARVDRCITTKYHGEITLAGVRGVAVADLIRRLGAESQRADEVSRPSCPHR